MQALIGVGHGPDPKNPAKGLANVPACFWWKVGE